MPTRPDQWETVKSLFEAALEVDSAQRPKLLAEQCQDANVRAEVERLLAEYDEAGAFLSSPPLANSLPEPDVPIRRFVEGDLLAQRFRIIRFLAAGGMGEVYEAEDLELREHVAIKTIRPEILAQTNSLARFKREVRLARQVTHPNVCRIFDLFRHTATDIRQPETVFVSMELLRGQTLRERLKTCTRISTTEALPLMQQMASALAAAHAVGIVHRDFKPGNVILVSGPGQPRAVVTDFGLALQSLQTDEGPSLSTGLALIGTPAYMAPEQIEGRPATMASDIYALGLVIYEILTGARPFEGDAPMSAAMKRLSEAPTPPRKFEPNLSPAWESAILRCLERDPTKRFANAEQFVQVLADAASSKVVHQRAKNRHMAIVAVLLLAVLAAGYESWQLLSHRGNIAENVHPRRRAVAVLGFKNLSRNQDQAWLSTALSEMLTTEIAAGDSLRTIPGEDVSTAKSDLKLPDANTLAAPTLSKLNRILGADIVVLGSYLDIGGQVRVDVRVETTSHADTVAEFSETGTEAHLFDVVRQLGATVREKCGVGGVTPEQESSIRASQPRSAEAAKLYSQGLDKLRFYDTMPARDLLSRAIAEDPGFALAHEALAEVWSELGYDERAKEESKRAYDLTPGMARPQALAIEARFREDSREWNKAVDIYRSLWTVFPDDPGYGLRLASALTSAGEGQEALQVVSQLRQFAAPMRDDPRIDLVEAKAARSISDYERDAAASEAAIRKATQHGSEGLRAEGLVEQCWALRNLGEQERAKSVGAEAGDIDGKIGNLRGQARSLTCLGDVLGDQGQLLSAQKMHEEALILVRKIGAQKDIAGALINLGNDLASQQDLTESTGQYRAALALALAIGDKADALLAQDNLGENSQLEGNFKAARELYDDSVRTAQEIGDQAGIAEALINRAMIFYLEGNLRNGKEDLQQAIEKARRLQLRTRLATALAGLGDVQLAQGDAHEAQSSYEQALQLRKELGEAGGVASSRVALASLALENGQAAQATKLASEAAQEFEAERDPDQQSAAENVLAQAFMAEGRYDDAAKAVALARNLRIRDLLTTLDVEITAAKLLVKTGQPGEAERELRQIESNAGAKGLLRLVWQARLTLAEAEIANRQLPLARANLASLKQETANRGYRLLARKASELEASLLNVSLLSPRDQTRTMNN